MKLFLLIWIMPLFLFSKVHYAKLEPYDSITLKSSVNAEVLEADIASEGVHIENSRIIYLDDRLDQVNLVASKKSLLLLEQMHEINQEIAHSLKQSVQRQEGYFKRISKLSTASKTQKDNAYSTFTSVKTQYLGTREKIVNLEKQILDMEYKVAQLEDTIDKKSIVLKDKFLYKLMVRRGDFVTMGAPLAQIEDFSKGKLILYLDASELKGIRQKRVYLNGQPTPYKVDKVWKTSDEVFISSYRAEIYIPSPKQIFSTLLKVELK